MWRMEKKPFIILKCKLQRIEIFPGEQEKKLLDFIDGKKPEDDFTRELDEAVQSVSKNEKWRVLDIRGMSA